MFLGRSPLMSTNLAATDSNSGAVASTESPKNNITGSNGLGVGLLESKSETLMKGWSSDHHEGVLGGGVSIDDARVFGDERGTVMESVEEVPEFNKSGVNDEDNKCEYKVFDDARVSGDEREVLMESVEVMRFSENGVDDKEKEGGDVRISGDTKAILMESVEEVSKFNENRVSDEQKEIEYMVVDEEALKFNENDEEKEGGYKVFDDAMVSEADKAILLGSVGEVSKGEEFAVDDEEKEGEEKVFDDVRVSGDEMGILKKPIEEVSKFNENGVNDEQKEGKLLDDARVSSDEKGILVEDVLEFNETGINDEEKEDEVFEDIRVSGDETGIVMEPIEEVSKFNENGVNQEGEEGKLLDGAKVSGDEKEILVEPVEDVLEVDEHGINDEEKEGEHKVSDDSRAFGDEKGTSMESVEEGLRSNENGVDSEEKEGTYKVFDLVWAKVKSYPWWPGMIFDPSASTKKARKYFKKDGLLIAYFGDQTFAWNEASKIKPFRMHFCEMEKQSNTKSFCNAVNCALDEAARRVEFGLACSCLSDEVYSKIKSQVFVNAGIRKESSRVDGGDNFSTVASFKPACTLQVVQDLAKECFDGISRLEALTAKAQLSAFYRWKGYYQLTPDKVLGESDDDNSELPSTGEEKLIRDAKTTPLSEEVLSRKRKLKTCDSGSSPSKKKRCSRDVKPNSSSSVPKREHGNAKSGSKRTFVESNGSTDRTQNGIADSKSSVSPSKKHFRVGDSICRIARQLSESPLILMKEPLTLNMPYSYPPTDEILSQICVAATNPVEEKHTMNTLVTFCTDFKNYLIEKNSRSIEINSIDKMCVEQPEENSYQSEAIEHSATALILKFTNLDSVPSVTNLNEIFSRYGPLREMETEVMKKNNCAKVVFERPSNAETAFSSAGKFSIFGPSLISYCLDYSPSPCKAPTRSSKRNRKD